VAAGGEIGVIDRLILEDGTGEAGVEGPAVVYRMVQGQE
jgi:hypothetical protein